MNRINGDINEDVKKAISNNPIIIVDTSCVPGSGNLRPLINYIPEDKKIDIIIDHHSNNDIKESDRFSSHSIYIKRECGACATLVHEILVENKVKIDSILATALYFGIENDTNNFRIEYTSEEDRYSYDKLEKKIDNKLLSRIISYPLPKGLLKLQKKALETLEEIGDMLVVGVGFILPSQKSWMADVANNLIRHDTVNHVCVMGVIDDGIGIPKKLAASLRTTGDVINTKEFIQTIFGQDFGGKKGAGAGAMVLDDSVTEKVDMMRDDAVKYETEFNSIYNGYVIALKKEKEKIS